MIIEDGREKDELHSLTYEFFNAVNEYNEEHAATSDNTCINSLAIGIEIMLILNWNGKELRNDKVLWRM